VQNLRPEAWFLELREARRADVAGERVEEQMVADAGAARERERLAESFDHHREVQVHRQL